MGILSSSSSRPKPPELTSITYNNTNTGSSINRKPCDCYCRCCCKCFRKTPTVFLAYHPPITPTTYSIAQQPRNNTIKKKRHQKGQPITIKPVTHNAQVLIIDDEGGQDQDGDQIRLSSQSICLQQQPIGTRPTTLSTENVISKIRLDEGQNQTVQSHQTISNTTISSTSTSTSTNSESDTDSTGSHTKTTGRDEKGKQARLSNTPLHSVL